MLIAGLGGNCKDVLADMANKYSLGNLRFYTDDLNDKYLPFFEKNGCIVYKGVDGLTSYFSNNDKAFISCIGNNYAREKQAAFITKHGGVAANHISDKAMINPGLTDIGNGNIIIMHFATVSVGSRIEEGAIIYPYGGIGHDVVIGRYAFVSAHCALSNAVVGDYTFIGLNSMVGEGVTIGKNCIIGANSYVKHDLPDNVIAVGSPAKIIRENKI